MKRIVYCIIISIALISCSTSKKQSADIEYVIQSKIKDSIAVISVAFDYKSDSNGMIKLRYENNSWGDNNIFNCINHFEVIPDPENIQFDPDNNQIAIKTKPYSKSSIHYDIVQDFKGPPLNQYRYRPIIDSSYFHVLGMRLFMVPDGIFESDTSKANINIKYQGESSAELFHSSFGKEYVQNISLIREDLYASFFVGGDFRRYAFTYENDCIHFVTRGHWKAFDDQDILNILKETISSQRNFWKDPRKGAFSVSLLPTNESWYSVGGSGFSTSFVSFASNNDKVSLSHMKWLYNHELLHRWIGRTILNENEVEQYWFSEGFTEYYAYKLLLKNNYLNIAEYIDIINKEFMIPHYQDPVKNIPNAELTFEKYWSNYAKYQKLPYRRGHLYAFYIDNQIKEQSHYTKSLDNLMIDIFEMALQDENMRLNKSLFVDQLLKYLNHAEVESDFNKYILDGDLIDFDNQLPDGISIGFQNDIPIFKLDTNNLKQLEKKFKK